MRVEGEIKANVLMSLNQNLKTHPHVWDNWQLKYDEKKWWENAFYFALFVPKKFKFLSWLFGHVGKRFDQKDKANSKIYEVNPCETINCNTHISQYLEK